jgi:hypothetical protein
MASSSGSRSSAKGPRVDTFVMPPGNHKHVGASSMHAEWVLCMSSCLQPACSVPVGLGPNA